MADLEHVLSAGEVQVMRNLSQALATSAHVETLDQQQNAMRTLTALRQRGFVTRDGKLTEADGAWLATNPPVP